MSFDREFYGLKDGQIYPTDQNCAETDLSVFCKERIDRARAAALEGLEALKGKIERAAGQLAGCQKGFFIGKAEKDEAYGVLCRFFLELEASKTSLMDEAVGLADISERLFEELWLTGEENTEITGAAKTAAMICDRLMLFCSDTLEPLCSALAQAADFERECAGVRIADTTRICGSFSESIANLQESIKGD